jgi:hypothetical protein
VRRRLAFVFAVVVVVLIPTRSARGQVLRCEKVTQPTTAGHHWIYVRVRTNKGLQVRPAPPPAPEGRVQYLTEQFDDNSRRRGVAAGPCFALTVAKRRSAIITWTRVPGHKSVRTPIDNVAPHANPATPIEVVVEVSDTDYVYATGRRIGQLKPLRVIPAAKRAAYLRELTLGTLDLSDNPGRSLEALASALDVDEWQIAYATVKFAGGAGCDAKCLDNPDLRLSKAATDWARRYRNQFDDAKLPIRFKEVHTAPP